MQHLTPEGYRRMPWANGGGETVEILRVGAPGGGLLFRLSMAQVVADGPFSEFPGIDRVLTVISGPGFDLVGPGAAAGKAAVVDAHGAATGPVASGTGQAPAPGDGPAATARLHAAPLVPVAFPGDLPVAAEGVTAPSVDFNVMCSRTLGRSEVAVLRPGGGEAARRLCLFALGPVQVLAEGAERALALHDLLICGGEIRHLSGAPALAVGLPL